MSLLLRGTITGKRVVVFSTAAEAALYCQDHPGHNYRAVTVYAAYKAPRMKKR